MTSQTIHNICVRMLHGLTHLENRFAWNIFKQIKMVFLKCLISQKDYIDNDITNIVCTKPDKNRECDRALRKIAERQYDVFRISPRAIVVCILNKNIEMMRHLRQYGYPLEMVEYASNFGLILKQRNTDSAGYIRDLCTNIL